MNFLQTLQDFVELFNNKQFKIFFWVVFSIILILSIYWLTLFQIQQEQKNRLPRLQNQCAFQSEKIFKKIQNKNIAVVYKYRSFYNDHLKRCFTLLHGDGINKTGTSDILINADTEEEIASCESHTTAPEIDFCRFNGAEGSYSLYNFQDFIKKYLENK